MNAVTRSDARRSATEAQHYIEQLRLFRRRHHGLKGVFLIQDGDPQRHGCLLGTLAEFGGGHGSRRRMHRG